MSVRVATGFIDVSTKRPRKLPKATNEDIKKILAAARDETAASKELQASIKRFNNLLEGEHLEQEGGVRGLQPVSC